MGVYTKVGVLHGRCSLTVKWPGPPMEGAGPYFRLNNGKGFRSVGAKRPMFRPAIF